MALNGNEMRTVGDSMRDLLADLNRDALTDALGVAAICVATVTFLWLPGLLAG